jgi:hypothetical protein
MEFDKHPPVEKDFHDRPILRLNKGGWLKAYKFK